MKVPVISRTVDRVKTSPVVIKTQNTVNAVKTRINGIQDRIATWTRTSLLGIEHVVPKVHPTPHNSPHQIDIPNGPKPTHTGSLDHRTSGTVHEPNVQLKPVEEPKVENLTPEGREAVRVLRDDRSLQPIHSEVDKPAQQIMYPNDLKSWVDTELPQASRIGSASEIDGTPVRYHNEFGEFHDAKRDYYQGLKNGGVEGPRPEFSPWKAEKTEADYNTAFEGLSEVEKTKHSIISLDKFKGVIPQEIKESVKSIWETGRLPEDKLWKKAQGPYKYKNIPENNSGGHILPEKDVNGNPITYTEYDVKPPELTNKENGKLGLDRGKHRLVVGSNGSIYYSPDHYLTFIRLID